MKSKEKLMGFLGAQGCRTGLLNSDDALVETADKLYGITARTIDEAASSIDRMTKNGRRLSARQGCAKHWPEACALFPKGSLARVRQEPRPSTPRRRERANPEPKGVMIGVYPSIEMVPAGAGLPTNHPPSKCARCASVATRWLVIDFGYRMPCDQNEPVCEAHAAQFLRKFEGARV